MIEIETMHAARPRQDDKTDDSGRADLTIVDTTSG
jgi:hypothetical protein